MATYKTPGVYVEEISTLPPSVAEVATAIPAFIGYTEKAQDEKGAALTGVVARRITSMLEYRQYFGKGPKTTFSAVVNGPETAIEKSDDKFILYYSMKLYFENGGGPCYIVSIDRYENANFAVSDFGAGMAEIALVDEPTLLLFPDATAMGLDKYLQVANLALAQCQKLGDRFTIVDVKYDEVERFRNSSAIPSDISFLKYGAAYTPYLKTLIPYEFKEADVNVKDITPREGESKPKVFFIDVPSDIAGNILKAKYSGTSQNPRVNIVQDGDQDSEVSFETLEAGVLLIKLKNAQAKLGDILAAWRPFEPKGGFTLEYVGSGINVPAAIAQKNLDRIGTFTGTLDSTPAGSGIVVGYKGLVSGAVSANVTAVVRPAPAQGAPPPPAVTFDLNTPGTLTIQITDNGVAGTDSSVARSQILNAFALLEDKKGFTLRSFGDDADPTIVEGASATLVQIREFSARWPNNTNQYFEIKYKGTANPPEVEIGEASTIAIPVLTPGKLIINLPATGVSATLIDQTFKNLLSTPTFAAESGFSLNLVGSGFDISPVPGQAPTAFLEIEKEFTGELEIDAEKPEHRLRAAYKGTANQPTMEVAGPVAGQLDEVKITTDAGALSIHCKSSSTPADEIIKAWNLLTAFETKGFTLLEYVNPGFSIGLKAMTSLEVVDAQGGPAGQETKTLDTLNTGAATGKTALYNQVKQAMGAQTLDLPPSPAIAGVYARVDRISGVWKSPANVGVTGISGPKKLITHEQQESLNVDPTSGKSINAIRSFTGKGTLVWGARTLAGNDNEWRYISVRRLFNMIEESVQKATAFAVFEANDTSTWLKVKAMIDSYLYGLWQQGALAGPTPGQAFFVNVGLGKTMNTQDILEGRMIVEIGIAAVRPAEFIILRFSHKMQEA